MVSGNETFEALSIRNIFPVAVRRILETDWSFWHISRFLKFVYKIFTYEMANKICPCDSIEDALETRYQKHRSQQTDTHHIAVHFDVLGTA